VGVSGGVKKHTNKCKEAAIGEMAFAALGLLALTGCDALSR